MKRKIIILFLVFSLMGLTLMSIPFLKANPTYEDYTTFTEVDIGSDRIQKTANHIDHLAYRNELTYLYKDYGVDYFGDFEHHVDMRLVSGIWLGMPWALANGYGSIFSENPSIYVYMYGSVNKFYLCEHEAGGYFQNISTMTFTDNIWYYFVIIKSGVSLSLEIYSDSARTVLLEELSLTLHTDYSFRYLYGCASYYLPPTSSNTIYDVENLEFIIKHSVTFYFNNGGQFRGNNATILNGSTIEYPNGTSLELASLPQNASYVFLNFTWNGSNSTTNPYTLNVTSTLTIWCYFSLTPEGYAGFVFLFFGLVVGLLVGALVGFGSKK